MEGIGRISLLRLDYLFSVIGPCLLAIYVNELKILNYLGIIFGWSFMGITGNLLNDAIDKDRGIDYTNKELGSIAIVCFALGITLMIETFLSYPITLVFALSSIFLVIGYCVKFKQYAIINKFVLVFSHIVFPYLMIRVQEPSVMSWGEICILTAFLIFAFSGQVIHEHIDQEASSAFSQRKIQVIVQVSSLLTIILGLIAVLLLNDYYFLPFVVAPIGTMYMYRKLRTPGPHIKDVGIIIGNMVMVYILVLVLM